MDGLSRDAEEAGLRRTVRQHVRGGLPRDRHGNDDREPADLRSRRDADGTSRRIDDRAA
jgi:hypothetical protein